MTTKADRIFTNHLLMDELDFWNELSVKSIDDDKTKKFYDSIVNNIDQQLEATVEWLASDDAKQYFYEESQYQEEIFEALEDEWEEILNNNYESIDDLLDNLYSKGKEKGYADMKEHIRYTDTDRLTLNLLRGYNFGLIKRLHNDVKCQVKNEIFEGMLKGEHPDIIASKILNIAGEQLKGSTFSPRQRATLIARTETSRVQNTGILQSYVNEGFREVKILTAEDDNVCYTCLRYAYEFNSDDKVIYSNAGEERVHNIFELLKGGSFPPFHPLCRCTYICVTETRGEIPKKPPIISLGPSLSSEFSSNGSYTEYGQKVYFSKEKLKNSLNGFVDEDDIDKFADLFFYFKKNILKESVEWCTGESLGGYIKKPPYTENLPADTHVPYELIEHGLDKGLLFLIHNHPTSSIPFPSPDDLESFFCYKVKYSIITNEIGTFILKNNKPKENKSKSVDVEGVGVEIKNKIIKDCLVENPQYKDLFIKYRSIKDREDNGGKLNDEDIKIKNEFYEKLNDYSKNNILKYIDVYKEKLESYDINIKFINSNGEIYN